MENEKKNKPGRPFGTFDWSDLADENVSRPKDITSDMWTPISAGKPETQRRPNGNLVDREKGEKVSPGKGSSKKNTSPGKKSRPQNPPGKKKNRPAQPAQKKEKQSEEQKRTAALQAERRNAARQRREELERARERRAYENERKHYEKASESYNRQRNLGSSREELSKKRARKKRRSKSFYAVTITAGILLAAVFATLIFCFAVGSPVAVIEVSGECVYSPNDVIAACGVVPGENIFTVREKKVNAVLSRALPYIGSVEVERNFPDKLILKVTPTSEKYLIAVKNSYICLDESEKVLSVKKKKLRDGTYRLEGFKGQSVQPGERYEPCEEDEKRFESAKRIIAALEAASIKKANVIKLESLDNIIVVYDSRFNIYLGGTDRTEKKLSLCAEVIRSNDAKSNTGYIDARFDSRAYFNEGKMEYDADK